MGWDAHAQWFETLPGVGNNRGGQVLSMSAITADKGGSFSSNGGGADAHIEGLQQLKGHLDNIIDGWEQPPGDGQKGAADVMRYSQSLPALQQQPRPSGHEQRPSAA